MTQNEFPILSNLIYHILIMQLTYSSLLLTSYLYILVPIFSKNQIQGTSPSYTVDKNRDFRKTYHDYNMQIIGENHDTTHKNNLLDHT
ncbi:MAG: hypothetical protein CMJ75_07625 [Planctomycetaceae bacterium]|nr:hypothetical protein [Planctomycetaceae bacterium]